MNWDDVRKKEAEGLSKADLEDIVRATGLSLDEMNAIMRESQKHRERFRKLLSPELDPLLLVLKGHLLIEEQLQRIIDSQIFDPAALKGGRWTFAQRVRLARASFRMPTYEWAWEAIGHLNKVRNELVHKSEPESGLDDLLLDFGKACEPARTGWREGTQLWRDLLSCWYALDTMVNVGKSVRTRMLKPK